MRRKKKGEEEVPGTGVVPDAPVEEKAPATTLPEQGISSKPIFLSAFLEEHNGFRTSTTMGPAFYAWVRLKDPDLLKRRLPEKEWLVLFDEFIKREVK